MLRILWTIASWTMLSRLLGLIRDQLLASFLGAGFIQDAYQIAFRLPNMFRNLFGEGAFNAAFVPIFTDIYQKDGKEKALSFAGRSFCFLALILVSITLLAEFFMPYVIDLIAPGFHHGNDAKYYLAIQLTRITFPYMIFICLAALMGGMLNSRRYFSVASSAYASFNIVGIIAILFGYSYNHHKVALAGAWGITISGVIQLALLLWGAQRHRIFPLFHMPYLSKNIKLLFKRMTPGLVGSGVTQINLTIDTIIATFLPTGSVSWLYFADRVGQLPLGILGAALGTALLPILSQHAADKNIEAMKEKVNEAMIYALIIILPASAGLIGLAPSIIGALFGYGHFQIIDILNASQCLKVYAIGLPFFVGIKILAPLFFANGDTKTPVLIALLTLLLNIIFNLLLLTPLSYMAPPLSSSIAALLNMLVMMIILFRRNLFYLELTTIKYAIKLFFISICMCAVIFIVNKHLFPIILSSNFSIRFLYIFLIISLSLLFYMVILYSIGLLNIKFLKRIFMK